MIMIISIMMMMMILMLLLCAARSAGFSWSQENWLATIGRSPLL